MSLYRKYRPHTFADVYGQEHVITTLEHAVEKDKLVHAYLFAGSRGTGKTSVARILAKTLMVRGIEDEVIRKQIEAGVDAGSLVDLLEIDAASNRGIDDIRELIDKIQFSPVVASAKVYIVDEVHMLTKEAFNALLKTLEEPPPFAYFILATTELNKIPETILSRCQCFPFRHIQDADIVRRLQFIADEEQIQIDREALREIARSSDGGMRDAISLLDQMRSLESITTEDVQSRVGTSGKEYIQEVLQAISAKDQEVLINNVRKVEDAGIPLDVFTRQLLRVVREALHENVTEHTDTSGLLSMMNTLLDAIRDIRISPVPGLALEAALLKLCETDAPPTKAPKAPAATPTPEPAVQEKVTKPEPSEKQAAIIEAPEVSLESIQAAWKNVIEKTTPSSVKMSLKNGRVTALQDKTISLSFASSFHKDKVAETDASRTIEGILKAHFNTDLKISCTIEDAPIPSEPASDDVVNMADAAAEIF